MTKRLELRVESSLKALPALMKLTRRFCEELGVSATDRQAVQLALEEMFVNVVNYAHPDGRPHPVLVSLSAEPAVALTIRIEDQGAPFDPTQMTEPEHLNMQLHERPVGGVGIHLARSLMHEMRYQREGDRNVLTMVRRLGVGRASLDYS